MYKRLKFTVQIGVMGLSALLLSACFGQPDAKRNHKPDRPSPTQKAPPPRGAVPAFSSQDSRECLVSLQRASVRYDALDNQYFGGGCSAIDSVKLMDIGVPVTNLGAMTCPLARSFSAWAQYAVRPAARQFFGAEVVKIETMGTYACRNINGASSGRLSQHASANAVDVSAFVLSDGRRISLTKDWQGDRDAQAFLRALHKSACRRFGTVLGPDYNRAHHDHFHFEMNGNGFCR
jgi:hypothetical protein